MDYFKIQFYIIIYILYIILHIIIYIILDYINNVIYLKFNKVFKRKSNFRNGIF